MNPDEPSYERRMETRLKEWGAEIEKLRERVAGCPEEVRTFCLDRIGTLETMRRNGFARLREMRQSGDDAWEEIRSDLDSHWGEMRRVFTEIYGKLD